MAALVAAGLCFFCPAGSPAGEKSFGIAFVPVYDSSPGSDGAVSEGCLILPRPFMAQWWPGTAVGFMNDPLICAGDRGGHDVNLLTMHGIRVDLEYDPMGKQDPDELRLVIDLTSSPLVGFRDRYEELLAATAYSALLGSNPHEETTFTVAIRPEPEPDSPLRKLTGSYHWNRERATVTAGSLGDYVVTREHAGWICRKEAGGDRESDGSTSAGLVPRP